MLLIYNAFSHDRIYLIETNLPPVLSFEFNTSIQMGQLTLYDLFYVTSIAPLVDEMFDK